MANVLVTQQQTFQATMLTLLTEENGGKLVKFCESDTNVVGETHTFYRIEESSTANSIDYYATAYAGTAGDTVKVTVTPEYVYAHGKIEETDLAKTNLDIKGAYAQSFKRAIGRAEDTTIINAIVAQDANLTDKGSATSFIHDQFDEFVQACAYATALADENADHGSMAGVAINRTEFSRLFASEKFTNSDYAKIVGGTTQVAGCELVPTDSVPVGTVYIIPQNTVCFASWSGGEKAVMEYDSGNDSYRVWARKSVGAGVSAEDAPSIVKFTSKIA